MLSNCTCQLTPALFNCQLSVYNDVTGVSVADIEIILNAHNQVRGGVQPAARNMLKMVNILVVVSCYVYYMNRYSWPRSHMMLQPYGLSLCCKSSGRIV